jgi:rhodanese-related sulfurtransferase
MFEFLRTLFRPKPKIETIVPAELYQRLQSDTPPLLLDVRTEMEYKYDGYIAGTQNLPLSELKRGNYDHLPKERLIVCICRSGRRSQIAGQQLASQGFEVLNLAGGLLAWRGAKLPLDFRVQE